MTPEERLAIWEETRRDWNHPVKDFLEHVDRGRDEAERDLPSRSL